MQLYNQNKFVIYLWRREIPRRLHQIKKLILLQPCSETKYYLSTVSWTSRGNSNVFHVRKGVARLF